VVRIQCGFVIDGAQAHAGAWFYFTPAQTTAQQYEATLVLGGIQAISQGLHTFGCYAIATLTSAPQIVFTGGSPGVFIVEEI
jgi:hypothetical protein